MTSPLQRAAEAVSIRIETHCPSCQVQLPGDAEDIARAVILAIREPSKEMAEAGFVDENCPNGVLITEGDAEAVWRAMIDAALSEQP